MSAVPELNLTHSFSAATAAARDKVSAAQADAQLGLIVTHINQEVKAVLDGIARDDNTLADQIVRARNLHPEVLTAFGNNLLIATILSGTTAPGADVGKDGDFYIDTVALTFYGPKADGAWPAGISMAGPPGPPGPALPEITNVAAYINLPNDLGPGDEGATFLVAADGQLYIWNGTAFPVEGSGLQFTGEPGPQGPTGPEGPAGPSGTPVDHDELGGIQGGTAGEEYHLTEDEHTALTGIATGDMQGLALTNMRSNVVEISAATLTLNAANAATYSGRFLIFTHADGCVITLADDAPVGYSIAGMQMDPDIVEVTASGGATVVGDRRETTRQGAFFTLIVVQNVGGNAAVWGIAGEVDAP